MSVATIKMCERMNDTKAYSLLSIGSRKRECWKKYL